MPRIQRPAYAVCWESIEQDEMASVMNDISADKSSLIDGVS